MQAKAHNILPVAILWMIKIIIVLAALYIVLCFVFWLRQNSIIYVPRKGLENTPLDYNIPFNDIWLETLDNVKLHGWYVESKEQKGTVLFFHGNAGNLSHRLETIDIWHNLGYNIFLLDYRGYGKSDGKPSPGGTLEDAEAAWKWLVNEKGVSPNDLIIHGRSLGGAHAAYVAQNHTPYLLILESTFTSIADMGKRMLPFLPVKLIATKKLNTIDRVSEIKCPILFVHSPEDTEVPFYMGEQLYERASGKKSMLVITGDHDNGFIESDNYIPGLKEFISNNSGW